MGVERADKKIDEMAHPRGMRLEGARGAGKIIK